jgi:hypothetical protein
MTPKRLGMIPGIALSLIILFLGCRVALAAEEAPRMTIEELKSMMGNPDLVILDVRSASDWKKSDAKIQGAIREDPSQKAKSWAEKYAKDKTIVLYCA